MPEDRIARLIQVRDAAAARGDRNLAAEAQNELDHLGYVSKAVPQLERRGPGRPRKNPLPTDVA